jgi:putative phosphoribosyl transferase
MYDDRRDAGRTVGRLVAGLPELGDAIVLGLPRGGVPVAFEVARTCGLPLDVFPVRKLGAPGQKELAMGAVAMGGTVVLNPDILQALDIPEETLGAVIERERRRMDQLESTYREGHPPADLEGRTAILVDDGLATGATMRAAARAVRPHARELILAVPVGARSTLDALSSEADRLICALTPEPLEAVGRFYRNFDPTTDDQVRQLLAEARRGIEAHPASRLSGW